MEHNVIEAENWRLREDWPEQVAAFEAKQELARTRDENTRLTMELEQVKQLLRSTQEAKAEDTPVAE